MVISELTKCFKQLAIKKNYVKKNFLKSTFKAFLKS